MADDASRALPAVEGPHIAPGVFGPPRLRIDGPAKVTGAALYPSDVGVPAPAFAWLVTSAIARGTVRAFRLGRARAVPGVLDILTHENVGDQARPPPPPGGMGGGTTTTMETDRIWHAGQIIAVVLAESLEAAREGAYAVEVDYAEEPPAASFGSAGATTVAVAEADKAHHDPQVGDARAAFAAAAVKVDGAYSTPTQHHNPMELFTTTAQWREERLILHESSQFAHGLRAGVARQLNLDPDKVRVLSPYVGGAFGSRGGITARTAWIAIAAQRLGRPVKLEATRAQGFTIATYRAETRQRVRLGAGADGRLQAVMHEGWEATSRPSTYNVSGTQTTARLYASPNVWTKVSVVQLDRNTPGFMRAPPETPYLFALESAMDELAVALAMDPIELRRRNDAQSEPIKGLPYTSRHLIECMDAGAKAFGWAQRQARPTSMRQGDWLVGYGMAAAAYPANIGASSCRLIVTPGRRAVIEMAAEDIGTGTYTIAAQIAADRLGLPIATIEVRLGDSDLPAAGLSAGSNHGSAVCNVVLKACEEARRRLAAGFEGGRLEIYAENVPQGAPADGVARLYRGQMAMARGSELGDEMRYAFGAQFVEVRVHARTREVRVPRAVGAFAAGTIINPVTARSQLMGGMIWGLSAALLEATEIDEKRARYVNDNLADYLVPVNADIGEVEVIMLAETDPKINPLGMKGIGELGTTGMNAALANAVFHATGVRVRDLPVRIETLL